MLPVLVTLMVVAAVVLAGMAAYVWWRRGSPAGLSLAVLLLAVAWWSVTYALELTAPDLTTRAVWGDLKYVGVAAVPPAWLVFVLRYTGRDRWLSRRLLVALAVEPLAVVAVLANDATHDLIRSYPATVGADEIPIVETGPLFWVHLVYANVLVLMATGVFVVSLARISRLYWRVAASLTVAALLPLVANALHNFEVGAFTRIDLTPFVFTASGAVLVWGLYRERLLNLTPVARGLVVEQMPDPVLVLDAYRRLVDANPAAVAVLGGRRAELVGRSLADVLPGLPATVVANRVDGDGTSGDGVGVGGDGGPGEVALVVGGRSRHFEVRDQALTDSRGAAAGEVLVLRDVTARRDAERELRHVLAERTRIASALQSSLAPAALPRVPGLALAQRYRPAGDGKEIGGDVVDVFPCGEGRWGVVIGDVSGKGAEAAALTALVRWTVRTLAAEGRRPAELLSRLNSTLLREGTGERYCTLAFAVARPRPDGVRLDVCLAGHHPPLLARADGSITAVGVHGTALGLLAAPELTEVRIDLVPGDLMLWFTDGLVEARRDGEQLGETRVAEVLRAHHGACAETVVDAVEGACHGYAGGQLADDLALLVLRAETR